MPLPLVPQTDRHGAVNALDLVLPGYPHLDLQRLQAPSVSHLPGSEAEVVMGQVEVHLWEAVPQYWDVEAAAVERHQDLGSFQRLGQRSCVQIDALGEGGGPFLPVDGHDGHQGVPAEAVRLYVQVGGVALEAVEHPPMLPSRDDVPQKRSLLVVQELGGLHHNGVASVLRLDPGDGFA